MNTTRLTPLPAALVLSLVLVAGATLQAANAGASDAVRYEQADSNGDGKISRQEFIAGVRNKTNWWSRGDSSASTGQNAATPEMFTALDRNRDGYLTPDELEAGRRLRESRGDDGAGASRSRDVNPPGSPESSSDGMRPTGDPRRVAPPDTDTRK
ncbi:MAG TPA: hypothetical protein VHN79_04840 [Lacunisphaera sp.]|nr:hypothetical protein [Lacunisphaera sp.]